MSAILNSGMVDVGMRIWPLLSGPDAGVRIVSWRDGRAVCVPECPANAIFAEEDLPSDQLAFIKLNAELTPKFKSITKRKPALPDADEWKDKPGKISELVR